ncbi:MAG: DEAD/DEAH box helicase, partial [Gammaproteobacteria bacterium]|nr:DEAD/DEAH box helicase [Gammaproteobacteria bacterium]
ERNLRAPLAGISRSAERLGLTHHDIRIAVRTGDTPQSERRQQLKSPARILVTTPESLYLLLSSRACETLGNVRCIIVDEIHALAPTKRGAHLALSLERLSALCELEPQRIGLSATVRPMDRVGRFLCGSREVTLVDASTMPMLDLQVSVPVPDMEAVDTDSRQTPPGGAILAELYAAQKPAPPRERGIWPAIYPRLLDEIATHRSTIVFVNSRGLCERLTQRLNELAGEELVLAHHGSVSQEKRAEIEDALKSGRLRAIVATSSLELGIDMGAVDRVLLVESPGSVARALQRIGRAGHQVGTPSSGCIYPKFKGDLLECAVVAERMLTAEIESVEIPRNPLDVLAQHIVSMCAMRSWRVAELQALLNRACPYAELSPALLESVLDMLSGAYPSTDFADLRPRIVWDRATDTLSARRGSAMLVRMNAGTIPDRGLYAVHLGEGGPRLGELDEEMVFETRPGDNILLGASTWRVEQITRDRVLVSPAPGEPGRLPFWRGDGPGRPLELGRAVGRFLGRLGEMRQADAHEWLRAHTVLDENAAINLAGYLSDQKSHCGVLPSDRTLVVECFRDELGDWRVCLLSPFGARVHAPWAMAIQHGLTRAQDFDIQVMYTDDGIVLRFADLDELPPLEALLPDVDELEETITTEVANSALFAGLFRENAARALLLPRRSVTARNPLWAQRIRAQQLLATAQRYPSFPIVLETYRQALKDIFDIDGLKQVLRDVRSGAIAVRQVETPKASPFARSLV